MKRASTWLLPLVVLAWFWPVPLGARATSPTIDTHSLPLASWFADSLDGWQIPEWNSLDGTGTPALARSEIAPYYPPNQIAYRLFDPARAWTLLLVLHTLAAAIFARLCARGFGLGPWASLLVGIVFAGQGFFITHADCGWAAATACWLPLAIWSGWKWLETGSTASLLGLSGVLAIQSTAGHFQLSFMTVTTLVGLSLAQRLANRSNWITVVLRTAGTGLAILVAACLAAAQLLPSAELAQVGDIRGRDAIFLGSHSTPPWHLLAGQLAPTLVHSDPLWQTSAWTPWQASPTETLGYVGLLTIGLAVLGLAAGTTDRRGRLWGLLLLVALALSLGRNMPGYEVLGRWPGFAWFPAPGRWSVVAGLWWAMLAGRGLERLASPRLGTWCQWFSLAAILTLATATWAIVSGAAETDAFFERPGLSSPDSLTPAAYSPGDLTTRSMTPATQMTRLLSTGLTFPVLALAAMALLGMTVRPIAQFGNRPGLVVLLVAIDLGAAALLLRPMGFTWDTYAPASSSPLLKRLARDPGSRVVTPLGRLPMAAGLATFDNPSLPDVARDWQARKQPGTSATYGWPNDWWPLPSPSRRDTLGVLLARLPARLTENDLALMQWTGTRRLVVSSQSTPRTVIPALRSAGPIDDPGLARLQHRPQVDRMPSGGSYTTWTLGPTRPAARAWFVPLDTPAEPGTDPSLERQPPPPRRDTLSRPQVVEKIIDGGDVLELAVGCEQPGAVVLADQAYPGWTATRSLAGSAAETADIDLAWGRWRMVRLPQAGDWTVRFQFDSVSHRVGRQVSLLALVAWIALSGLHWWFRRQVREPIHAGNTPELESVSTVSPEHNSPGASGAK